MPQVSLLYLIIAAAAAALIFAVIGFFCGVSHRKKKAEAAIGSAEEQAKRILSDAIKSAESKKKESVLEAKDEIHRLRSEADREIRDRRSEVQRQEHRLVQKEESLDKKLENIAEKTDLEMRGIIEATYVGDFSSGSGIPDDFITDIKADFGSYTIEIQSNGSIVAMYNGFEGEALPEEYSFTYNNTTEGEALETIRYIYENYSDIIGLPEATFVTSKEYTFSGEEIRDYRIYDFSGDEIKDMLNFAFSEVQLAPNDEGKLMLIRINDKLSCGEKIGDYPIISPEEAKDMLLEGGYITTVPYEMPGKKYIAKCELIYRSGISENIWMPYYRFLVELPEMAQENGLKNFGAYYVPAVELEYIEGLPLWNGNFN